MDTNLYYNRLQDNLWYSHLRRNYIALSVLNKIFSNYNIHIYIFKFIYIYIYIYIYI